MRSKLFPVRAGFSLPLLGVALFSRALTSCGGDSASPPPAADGGPFMPVPEGGTPPPTDGGDGLPPPDDAGDAGDDAPAPPLPTDSGSGAWGGKPSAKGLWIWYLDYVGMTADQAATIAQNDGVGYVLVKSGQDGSFWNTRFTKAMVNAFTSRGMAVLAWPYITPGGGSGAVDAVAKAMAIPGVSGAVLDVEIEWEGGHGGAATTLCKNIRSKVPGIWLGYTSFGWPGYHGTFPWKEFDKDCGDGAWPQVYFSDRGVSWNGSSGISQAISQYKALGLKAPFWPIASNDNGPNYPNGPSTADLNGFLDQTAPWSSLWEFPAAGLKGKVKQLSSIHWKNP